MTFLCPAPLSYHANYGAAKASCSSLGGKWFEGGAGEDPESESLGQRWGINGEDGKMEGGVPREVEMENIRRIFEKGMYL